MPLDTHASISGGLPVSPEALECARAWVDMNHRARRPGDPLRHHFIPQSFLRRFAGERDQLAVVRLDDPTAAIVTNVSNVAVVRQLYATINDDLGETVAIEYLMALIEALAVAPIAQLGASSPFPMTDEDRLSFLLWRGMLWVRDPDTRRTMEAAVDVGAKLGLSVQIDHERGDQVPAATGSATDRTGAAPAMDDLDEIEFAPHENQLVQSMLWTGQCLAIELWSRFFAVVRFPSPELVLPDRPMRLYVEPDGRAQHGGVGPASADEIRLPIDRSTALLLHRDTHVGDCER